MLAEILLSVAMRSVAHQAHSAPAASAEAWLEVPVHNHTHVLELLHEVKSV